MGKLCHHAGANRVAVAATNLAAFARRVRKMGSILPPAAE
jgi:hypothetical protein